jgi:hypothetical protein
MKHVISTLVEADKACCATDIPCRRKTFFAPVLHEQAFFSERNLQMSFIIIPEEQ